jgi:hypothetical protein
MVIRERIRFSSRFVKLRWRWHQTYKVLRDPDNVTDVLDQHEVCEDDLSVI